MKKPIFLCLAIFLSACLTPPTPAPTFTASVPIIIAAEDNAYAPQPGDNNLRVGGVILTSISLTERADLTPARAELNLFGSLPSVCNELRVKITPPNTAHEIFVQVYSLINAKLKCDDVFQQFEADIVLGLYSAGTYTVWVNQGRIGDFVVY
jgi:hypothetical protein